MMEKSKNKIWPIVIIAAIVAALTTLAIYVLNKRAKKKYLRDDNDFDFAMEEDGEEIALEPIDDTGVDSDAE